jgi:hypothetical protein
MTDNSDELQRQLRATLDRSADELDPQTLSALQQARQQALASTQARRNYRPAMMIAASLVALILAPWLALQQQEDSAPDFAQLEEQRYPEEQSYLSEDPDMLADWDMLDAIGEVPDA